LYILYLYIFANIIGIISRYLVYYIDEVCLDINNSVELVELVNLQKCFGILIGSVNCNETFTNTDRGGKEYYALSK